MRCRSLFVSTILATVLTACGEPQPVSTGTKAPGLNPITTTPATTPATTGDATKGQTALTTSCSNLCHNGATAHKLVKADSGSITSAAGKSYHSSVSAVFTASGADISAYLATQ